MFKKTIVYFFMCLFTLGLHTQASFLESKYLDPQSEKALHVIEICIKKIKETLVGRQLIEKIVDLWKKYLAYEPTILLNISEGDPQFTGEDTKSPLQPSITGASTVKINLKTISLDECNQKLQGTGLRCNKEGNVEFDDMWTFLDLLNLDPHMVNPADFGLFIQEYCNSNLKPFILEEIQTQVEPRLTLLCPIKTPILIDIENADCDIGSQPAATNFKDKMVYVKKHPVKLFLAVAHELIHMKHFLEERIFICQIVEGLIKKAAPDTKPNNNKEENKLKELRAYIKNTFCRGLSSDPDEITLRNLMIRAANNFVIFKELCTFAKELSIPRDYDIKPELTDLESLAFLPYSFCKIEDTDLLRLGVLPEVKILENKEREALKVLITDLEERRTVMGPDRNGITENALRIAFGEPIRFIYQDHTLDVPIQDFEDVLQNDVIFQAALQIMRNNSKQEVARPKETREKTDISSSNSIVAPQIISAKTEKSPAIVQFEEEYKARVTQFFGEESLEMQQAVQGSVEDLQTAAHNEGGVNSIEDAYANFETQTVDDVAYTLPDGITIRMYRDVENDEPLARMQTGGKYNVCPLLSLGELTGESAESVRTLILNIASHLQKVGRKTFYVDLNSEECKNVLRYIVPSQGNIHYDLLWFFLNPDMQQIEVADTSWWEAIADVLGATVHIYTVWEGTQELRKIVLHGRGEKTIQIFHRDLHYNLMLPKQTTGERIKRETERNKSYKPMF